VYGFNSELEHIVQGLRLVFRRSGDRSLKPGILAETFSTMNVMSHYAVLDILCDAYFLCHLLMLNNNSIIITVILAFIPFLDHGYVK
jgi:hypothetical protein